MWSNHDPYHPTPITSERDGKQANHVHTSDREPCSPALPNSFSEAARSTPMSCILAKLLTTTQSCGHLSQGCNGDHAITLPLNWPLGSKTRSPVNVLGTRNSQVGEHQTRRTWELNSLDTRLSMKL
ncbi:hypothetical protein M404DRAFT_1009342, partial [Pisolithus tinctorius Marx 270]